MTSERALVSFASAEVIPQILRSPDHLLAALLVDDDVVIYTGTFVEIRIPIAWFEPNEGCRPDFTAMAITDHGQTLVLGDYEVSVRSILKWRY